MPNLHARWLTPKRPSVLLPSVTRDTNLSNVNAVTLDKFASRVTAFCRVRSTGHSGRKRGRQKEMRKDSITE